MSTLWMIVLGLAAGLVFFLCYVLFIAGFCKVFTWVFGDKGADNV